MGATMVSSAIALEATENVSQPPLNNPVQVLAVTGGKGGVGKSNVAINLAIEMGKLGRSVLVLDADLGLANIDVLCGLQAHGTLDDVLRGDAMLDDILVTVDDNVSLLPASTGVSGITTLTQGEYGGLIQAFSTLREPVDTMVIDTAAGITDQVTAFCRAAREVLVVVCDEPTSITDAYAMIKVLLKKLSESLIKILTSCSTTSAPYRRTSICNRE